MVTSDYWNRLLCFLAVVTAAISSVQAVSIKEIFYSFLTADSGLGTQSLTVRICQTLQLEKPCWHLQSLLELKTAYSLVKNKSVHS